MRPNHGACSLRSRRTMQLAYFMPLNQLEPSNLIMMQFMQSLLRESARQHCGYTRPAYIGYASGTYWDAEREAGFRAGLARCASRVTAPGCSASTTTRARGTRSCRS